MALSTVAKMEKMAMEGATQTEKVTLPNRIAALERAIFGESASATDLEKMASLEQDYKELQDDYVVLSEEYQILKDRPPVVIQKEDDKSAFLEEQMRKMQEQYQAIQQKLNKLRVEHLELQTSHAQMEQEHQKVKDDAAQMEKQLNDKLGQLQKIHAKLAKELQQVRSEQLETTKKLAELKEDKSRLVKELRTQQDQNSALEQLRHDFEDLLGSFHRLQEDHEQLQEKSDRFRSTMTEGWRSEPGTPKQRSEKNLLPPLTPTARGRSEEREMNSSQSEGKLPGLVDTKEARFPTSLLEPRGPLSVTHLKTRIMEIKGRVLYCNDKWQESSAPRRNTVSVYDVDADIW